MILMIGGYNQGQNEYALSKFDSDKVIVKLHESIRAVQNNQRALDALRQKAEGAACVTCDEVGSGVVPIEKEERVFREAVGRMCCYLAEQAETVIRFHCGIPVVIKGEALL